MPYEGEHLLIGQVGHFFALLALVASIAASFAYYKSTVVISEADSQRWRKFARTAFILDVVSVLALFLILYLIIYNHYFEYKYAHQHSKRSLDVQYLLSCFWEGQEGSFHVMEFLECGNWLSGHPNR